MPASRIEYRRAPAQTPREPRCTAPMMCTGALKSIFKKINPGADAANYMEGMGGCQLCGLWTTPAIVFGGALPMQHPPSDALRAPSSPKEGTSCGCFIEALLACMANPRRFWLASRREPKRPESATTILRPEGGRWRRSAAQPTEGGVAR